jgi:uncharacterized protein
MKLHLTTAENFNLITAYRSGYVEINKVGHNSALIVTTNRIITPWHTGDFDSLNEASLVPLIDIKPEVVILGTGEKHRFLRPQHFRNLTELGIPIEYMTTDAACRTFNILVSEGRLVAAALILQG